MEVDTSGHRFTLERVHGNRHPCNWMAVSSIEASGKVVNWLWKKNGEKAPYPAHRPVLGEATRLATTLAVGRESPYKSDYAEGAPSPSSELPG
jgi:hypothetical protein